MVSEEMIEAGLVAHDKICAAMRDRNLSDEPECMDDYDAGDLCRAIYLAMRHAEPIPDVSEVEAVARALWQSGGYILTDWDEANETPLKERHRQMAKDAIAAIQEQGE